MLFFFDTTQSTFIAVIQATTLANSFNLGDDATHSRTYKLHLVTNVFSFAGIVMDVSAGFFSLMSASFLVTAEQQATLYRGLLDYCTVTELVEICSTPKAKDLKSPIGCWMYNEAQRQFKLGSSGLSRKKQPAGSQGDEQSADSPSIIAHYWASLHLESWGFLTRVDELGTATLTWLAIGKLAEVATQCGILFFFISLVLLTAEAQPKAVWITTAAILVPIVLFSTSGIVKRFYQCECALPPAAGIMTFQLSLSDVRGKFTGER